MSRRIERRNERKVNYEEKSLRQKQIDFKRHLRTYLVMSAFFITLNALGGSNNFWAIWPILGWGIGVALQGLSLYGPLADPEDVHPADEEEFSGPLPEVEVTDEDLRRRRDALELKELERRPFRDEDLV
jgi:hypothetical protein